MNATVIGLAKGVPDMAKGKQISQGSEIKLLVVDEYAMFREGLARVWRKHCIRRLSKLTGPPP